MKGSRSRNTKRTFKISTTTKIFFFSFVIIVLVGASIFYFTRESRAAAGDHAIYREATGTESITTTLTDQTWDTTVTEGTPYTLGGSNINVTLSEQGHYLAMYNIGVENVSGSNEVETQGYLNVNGTQSNYGRASCSYLSTGGNDECWMYGASIIETTATNQTIKVQAQRTDTGGNSARRIAGDSGFQLVRLDDDWDYARVREAGGGQAFNSATWATVSLDTNDELDTGTFSRTDGDITIATAGKYLITTHVHFVTDESKKNRSEGTRLTLDGTEINGTRVTAVMPADSSTQDAVASYIGIIETTSANQVLRLQGSCTGEGCAKTTNATNGTAITIVALPDIVETVRVTETGGGQQVYATADPITWDTTSQVDTAVFQHSTGATSSRITVLEDDDYLFMSTFYDSRTDTGSTVNMNPHWEWRDSGSTVLGYGSFDKFIYGDDGRDGIFNSGGSGGAIFDLTADDYIEVINTNETAGIVTNPTFQANLMALQGIRLSSLQEPDIEVTALGTQNTNNNYIPETDFYIGGSFAFTANHSFPTESITSVTITETGSIDASTELTDIKLFYDLDVTDPYNCVGETYAGTETQYGSTDTDGFSQTNGSSTFTGAVTASTTQAVCMYVVMTIDETADVGDTIEIEISNPSIDVELGDSGPVAPETTEAIPGTTTLIDDALRQMHYHWRNDDGNEAGATSATGGTEDTKLLNLPRGVGKRLRIEVSNEGNGTSPPVQYRLEYATLSGSCAASTGWTDVGAGGGDWDMNATGNLSDGTDTSNIILGSLGAVTDENITFLTPNGAVKDLGSQTGNITLTSSEFVEIEYSIIATSNATEYGDYCFRVTDAGATTSIDAYSVYPEVSLDNDIDVTSVGSQTTNVDTGDTNFHIGGAFAIIDSGVNQNVTSITINEVGTIDAQNDLSNIELYYELDTSDPYNCVGETYAGTEDQYGLTDADGFSGANGNSVFTETVAISQTSAMCVYAIVDVDYAANEGDTIDIEISDPSSDILVSEGTIEPNTPIGPTGVTTVQKDRLEQIHFHWRNDDNNEALASSATGGTEDTSLSSISVGTQKRLRVEVSNEGSADSLSTQFRLEYATRTASCVAATGWIDVGAVSGAWDMYPTGNLTEDGDTTNIAEAIGGVTDENTTFLTPNGGVKDTSSQTNSITLTSTEFVELEYSVVPTVNAVQGETYCFRVTDAGTELPTYTVYPDATLSADVLVSSLGSQTANVSAGTSDFYIGGAYVIQDQGGSRNVTSIVMTETGTVDAQNDLSEVRLYYEIDNTNPYDCSGLTYNPGVDAQYGATSSSFSAADGTATFSQSVGISSTQTMCVYAVVDVDSTANNGDTIDIEINNPGNDVSVSTGTVNPNTPVGPTGVTTVQKAQLDQIHYHWRNDDGNEAGASSATGGTEDTVLSDFPRNKPARLRVEVSNEGTGTSQSTQYRLEYGVKGASCDAATGWTDVGAGGGAWDMYNSSFITDGGNTTNIGIATGGVTDENTTFLTPNNALKDTSSQTTGITLTSTEFVELEYSIVATANATEEETYCFRVTNAGSIIDNYLAYPEVDLDTDVVVSSLGSQTTNVSAGTSDFHIGGTFVIYEQAFNTDVTDITINEVGTIDGANDLANIELYYEMDTSDPYNCVGETYAGTEDQYGATDTDGFSGADGNSLFTETVAVSSTSAMCVYVVVDVDFNASNGDTIDIEISNPSTDVSVTSGNIRPATAVSPTGVTTVQKSSLEQAHYHWRLDDGNEAGASSATGGTEDTVLSNLPRDNARRLRIAVSNEGTGSSPAVQYRLEYTAKSGGSCGASTGWTDVGDVGGAWDMHNSSFITDGGNTTNIGIATGGVTDENTTFLTPNNALKDTSSQTTGITLTSTEFVELEYSIVATANATEEETYCFRVTDAGSTATIGAYNTYPEVDLDVDVILSAGGTQTANVTAGTNNFYIGGYFAIVGQGVDQNVTNITVSESGTSDGANHLANIELYYEMDTSDPYNCVGETYAGTENQYGSTDTDGFSGADGSSLFTEDVGITKTSTMCVYVVLDVTSSAVDGESINVEITDPSTEVQVSAGSVNPNTTVEPTSSTTIQKAYLEQVHFHWRNDDNTEALASSKTGGAQDTAIANVKKTETQRLRVELSNEGTANALPSAFTLEYAPESGSCSAATGWTQVGTPNGDWVMSDSLNLTHGNDTTNIAIATGGVTDENNTFLTPNSGVLDTSATSSSLTLTTTDYVELEYSIEATANASFGTTYCFRLVSDGTSVDGYTVYPRATIRSNQDYYIQRGETQIPNGNTSVIITEGVDYVAPSAASSAFIRINNTMYTGAGPDAGGGTQNMDNSTAHVSNPENITNSITFTRTGNTGDTHIFWEIVEYTGPTGGDNEMIVRSAQAHTSGNKSLTENISVNGIVDDNDVVVFLTGQSSIEADVDEYQTGIVTTDWNGATNEVVLERDAYGAGAGNAVTASFAVVEFTGSNWLVQRAEHTYTAVGGDETETITDVNDMGRAFIHTQHRTDQNTVANYGHNVWLSAVGTVSFRLDSNATTPGNHTSVAWVIENLQTNGTPMVVTRSNGSQNAGGTEPSTYSIAIGKTLSDMSVTSVLTNMYASSTGTDHPQGSMGVTLASSTHYELWMSDTGSGRSYRTEVVEWPTAILTVKQNYYRFYTDNDALDPTDEWPPGAGILGENTAITGFDAPPSDGERMRIRMSLNVTGANISQGSTQYRLEYGVRNTSCSAISSWFEIGDAASTTAVWRGYNATPLEGTTLSTNPPTAGDLNLSVSDRAGTYEEANPTAVNPYKIFIGDDVEYDWIVEANGVTDLTSYCFRMVEEDRSPLQDYMYYPTVTMAGFIVEQQDWEWFGDEGSITPSVSLAASNTAPINIAHADPIKLRVLLEETAGKDGENVKYKLQWSESSDFSTVYDVQNTDECAFGDEWCYFDGAGTEGATITTNTLVGADSCVGTVGDGCGTHNETSYIPNVIGEVGTTTTDSTGTTVNLSHTFDDPVFIIESISGDANGGSTNRPAAVIITATTTSSFDVRIQEPDNEDDDHGSETVAYLVMERGAYFLPDGRRVDVDTIDTAHYYGNAVSGTSDDTCSFTQTFTNPPVVLASVQSDNNTGSPDFLTASVDLVTASGFDCAMEVPDGESNAPGSSETYGWIAIEGGIFGNNSVFYEATTTNVSVTGWTDTPWYQQLFTQEFTGVPGIIATKQTRNGIEGGWVRYDNVDNISVELAFDERDDGERTHTSEGVGYTAFSNSDVMYTAGTSTFTFVAGAVTEFEFTLVHNNAKPNMTYFFRLYDTVRDTVVSTSTTSVPPSLSTEGASLTSSTGGISSGSATEGVVTDITTTATSVPFGSLSIGTPKVGAQRLSITTNAPNGYQILVYERQNLTSSGGATIQDVSGTNASPVTWSTGCPGGSISCYGYHVGDNTLAEGSNRFLLNDTFAAMTDTMEEVAYSAGPVVAEETDVVYKLEASATQPAGLYESDIVYVIVPIF